MLWFRDKKAEPFAIDRLYGLLSKFCKRKTSKVLACMAMCYCAILLDVMVVTDECNMNVFLILSFMTILFFIILNFILILFYKIDEKINFFISKPLSKIWNKIWNNTKTLFKNSYSYMMERFNSRWEKDLYFSGLLVFMFASYEVFLDTEFLDFSAEHLWFFVSLVLFLIAYRLILHIIFLKKTKEE